MLFLLRHGETEWNRERRVMGRGPMPLSERGREQVRGAIPLLSGLGIERVWTSPLPRARETAEQVAGGLGGLVVEVEEELTEVDYSGWEGRTFPELIADPAYRRYLLDPENEPVPGGGESLADVQARMYRALARVLEAAGGARSLVVSHGDPIRVAVAGCLGVGLRDVRRLRIDNAAVSAVELTGRWTEVKFVNVRSDLGEIATPAVDGARVLRDRSGAP